MRMPGWKKISAKTIDPISRAAEKVLAFLLMGAALLALGLLLNMGRGPDPAPVKNGRIITLMKIGIRLRKKMIRKKPATLPEDGDKKSCSRLRRRPVKRRVQRNRQA